LEREVRELRKANEILRLAEYVTNPDGIYRGSNHAA